MSISIPIITIDGLSSSGKSTISQKLASKLNWYLLDSGILYRAVGFLLKRENISPSDEILIDRIVRDIDLSLQLGGNYTISYKDDNISKYLFAEDIGLLASKVSQIEYIRTLLLKHQNMCAKHPGLIANGRDMGSKVFPQAILKIFLIADLSKRAERRYKELEGKKHSAVHSSLSLDNISNSLEKRDHSDINRKASPLKATYDSITIDTTNLNIDSILDKILELYKISGV